MKQIDYQPKITGANTQYNQISQADMAHVQSQLIRYMALMAELKNSPDPACRSIAKQYWSKKTKTLPRGRRGFNSPETFTAGLLNNLVFGNQRDLSDIQMQALTNISAVVAEISQLTQKQQIQSACDPIESIMFKEKLFDWTAK